MNILTIGDLVDGLRVTCKLCGLPVDDAIIRIYNNCYYLCQNVNQGDNIPSEQKGGFRCSWYIASRSSDLGYPLDVQLPKFEVSDFKIGYTAEILKDLNDKTIAVLDKFRCTADNPSFVTILEMFIKSLRTNNKYDYISVHDLTLAMRHFTKDPLDTNTCFSRYSNTLSIGRYIRRVLEVSVDTLSSEDLEEFCYKLVINTCDDVLDKFDILSGEGLVNAYVNSVGSRSCMTGTSRMHRLDLYRDNPDKVRLLVLKDKRARALLWTLEDGRLYIDKCYSCNNDMASEYYRKWAMHQNAYVYAVRSPPETVRITLKRSYDDIEKDPYFDSFYVVERTNSAITLGI